MYQRHEIGKAGEDEVERYLLKNGYVILERNFNCKIGEIDVIAEYKNHVIFIEVKTRSSILYGFPAEAVTDKKLKNIVKTAKYYLHIKSLDNVFTRIDVIEVFCINGSYKINHIKQVV